MRECSCVESTSERVARCSSSWSAPPVVQARLALRRGDIATLEAALTTTPGLAAGRIGDDAGSDTLLHELADAPGHVPNGPASARVLVAARLGAATSTVSRMDGGAEPGSADRPATSRSDHALTTSTAAH